MGKFVVVDCYYQWRKESDVKWNLQMSKLIV
jgi:hypothetical protein